MGGLEMHFERDFEFSPAIVWDALIDTDLVVGWLAEARIDPVVGGQYSLRWMTRPGATVVPGTIADLRPSVALQIAQQGIDTIAFRLTELEGGTRGTSTRLRVEVRAAVEPVFAARVSADWMTALDQLDDLLHGHPVDWSTWQADRNDAWTRHRDDAAG